MNGLAWLSREPVKRIGQHISRAIGKPLVFAGFLLVGRRPYGVFALAQPVQPSGGRGFVLFCGSGDKALYAQGRRASDRLIMLCLDRRRHLSGCFVARLKFEQTPSFRPVRLAPISELVARHSGNSPFFQ